MSPCSQAPTPSAGAEVESFPDLRSAPYTLTYYQGLWMPLECLEALISIESEIELPLLR